MTSVQIALAKRAFKLDPNFAWNEIKAAIEEAAFLNETEQDQLKQEIVSKLLQSPQLRSELRPMGANIENIQQLLGLSDESTLAELRTALEGITT